MTRKITWLILVFSIWAACATVNVQAQTLDSTQDPVLEWNVNMLQAMSKATPNGLFHSRWAAIIHASIHDTVVSFTGDAEPYAGITVTPPSGASTDAAVIAAAHFTLVHLFPAQQPALDAQYASSLAARGLTASDPGVQVGESIASQVLALRATDGAASAQFPYTAPDSGNAGVWVPTPPTFAPALLPGWPRVTVRTRALRRESLVVP